MTKGRKHSTRKQPMGPVEPSRPASDQTGSKSNRNGGDDQQFGLRVEADRTWTVYHVFSGIPVESGGDAMSGLDRHEATSRMLSLNRRAVSRSGTRAWVNPPALDPTADSRK